MRTALAFVLAILAAGPLCAQVRLYVEPTKQLEPSPAMPAAEDESSKPWSLEINLDWTSVYADRGYNTVNQGVIVQPSVEFDYTIVDQGGFTITPYVGSWHNITSERIGDGSPRWWAEADVYPGLKFGYANFELDIYYNLMTYPNRSSGQQEEIDVALSYDDSAMWESSRWFAGFQPHVGIYMEIRDLDDEDCNQYLELGLEPTAKPINLGKWPVTLSLPLLLGTSPDSYYTSDDGHNEFFGYVSAGLKASTPIHLVPGADCSLTAEVDWIHMLADSTREANNDSDDAFTARVGTKIAV